MENNKEKTEHAKRLELLTLHFNMTTRDLAGMIGLNENTLYKINCGKSEMSERTAARICYQMEKNKGVVVNRNWLLYGEGSMFEGRHDGTQYEYPKFEVDDAAEKPLQIDSYKDKYFDLLEKYSRLQAEYNAFLKKMLS